MWSFNLFEWQLESPRESLEGILFIFYFLVTIIYTKGIEKGWTPRESKGTDKFYQRQADFGHRFDYQTAACSQFV